MNSSTIFSKNSLTKIGKKLNYLGLKIEARTFSNLRLATTIILFFLLIFTDTGYIIAPLITIIYYFIFELCLLDLNINLKRKRLENDAIEYFEIFLLVINKGHNIKNAIKTTNETIENSISREFDKVLIDIKIGKSLDEALNLMIKRTPSEIIKNILYSLTEANKYGNSINNTINNQIEYIKTKKNQKIIYKNKIIPVKIFITTCIFTILILLSLIIYKIII